MKDKACDVKPHAGTPHLFSCGNALKGVLGVLALMAVGTVMGKEVTLTFSSAGNMSTRGTWTTGGAPCTKEDLAEGDTLIVDTGTISSGYISFEDFETPPLAVFRPTGSGAVNFSDLKLNMQDNGILDWMK